MLFSPCCSCSCGPAPTSQRRLRQRGKSLASLAAPAAPTNLRFDAPTDSSCTVRWDASDGATDYDVNYKPAVDGRWTNEPHRGIGLSNTIHDLQPNTEYRWAVRAENSDGASEWIHGPNFTTRPSEDDGLNGVPASPTNLRFDAPTDSSCTVRWDASDGATDYDINYKLASGGKWINEPHAGDGLYNTIHDLEPETEYRWAVRAENSDGASAWVFGPNFTTLPDDIEGDDSVETDSELPPLDDPLDGWVDTGSVDGDHTALMAIWDTFGQNTRLRKWGTRSSLRKWEGVKVDDRGRVIELSVPLQNHFDRSVRIPLPADIGQLTQLRALEIFAFAGALPPEIGNLRMLERLNILVWSEPDVVNTVPEEWGQLTQLRYMQIECSGCVGSIPASFGNLRNLEHLSIDAHNMAGPLPTELGNLSRLKTLDLSGMIKLSGPFPTSLDNLGALEIFRVVSNDLIGPFPNFAAANNMKVISIHKTAHGLTRAEQGSIDFDYLTIGTLPPSWGHLTNLESISLSVAEGPLPPEWGQLANLRELYLGVGITGQLPPEWASMSSLETIHIVDQELEGPLPSEWSSLTNLKLINLSSNLLEGELPSEWSSILGVRDVNLSFNYFSGELPAEWGAWKELERFDCNNCGLSGEIPATWANHSNIEFLDLSSNELTGAPPDWWDNKPNLRVVSLRDNNFVGPFPKSLAKSPYLNGLLYSGEVGWSIDPEGLTGCVPRALATKDQLASIWNERDWGIYQALGHLNFCKSKF